MRLTTKLRYGLRIMTQMAAEGRTKPLMARRISARQRVSVAYIDQILIPLRTSGLIISQRGRKGGYLLARPPDQISALDVLEALEGKIALNDCVTNPQVCDRSDRCATRELWSALTTAMRDKLAACTLDGLAARQSELLRLAKPRARE